MELAQAAWVVSSLTAIWMLGTLAVQKFPNTWTVILSVLTFIGLVCGWTWYSIYTKQYAFITLGIFLVMALIGGYDGRNKS